MSAVSMNEAAKKTAQLENAKEACQPGGAPQEEHLPREIFVCSPYRPTSQDEKCRKDELEANIRRAKMEESAAALRRSVGVKRLISSGSDMLQRKN